LPISCDYCGETNEYVPIILKPAVFFWKNSACENVQAYRRQDFTCLDCFSFEINEIKDTY
jgi:hypothetical protein